MKYLNLFLLVLLAPIVGITQYVPLNANPGFENNGTFTNWVLTGSGALTRSNTNFRSGLYSARIRNLTNTYSTLHNTSYGVAVPATGTNYVTVMAWARGNNATVAVDAGTSADVNGPTTPGGTSATITNTYTRVSYTFLAVNGTTYHPVLYARGNNIAIRWDDVIIFTSTQSGTDIDAPAAPSAFTISATGSNVSFNFTQGGDAGANQSGIGGVTILRSNAAPMLHTSVTLTPQVFYSTNANVGPNLISNFTVVYDGAPTGTFTEAVTSQAVYLVYMRDRAFNYTANTAAARLFVVNSTTANYTVSNAATNVNADGIYVSADDAFTITSGGILTLNAGANSQIDGTINASGTLNTANDASRITFKNGSVFRWQNSAGSLATTATWNAGSLCWINNTTNGTTPSSGINQTFSNFRWQMPLQTITYVMPANFGVAGNFELLNSGTGILSLVGGAHIFGGNLQLDDDVTLDPNTTITLNGSGITQTVSGVGSLTPNIGTLNINTSGGGKVLQSRNLQINTAFNISSGSEFDGGIGGFVLAMAGNSNFNNNGAFTSGNGVVRFDGTVTGPQTISTFANQPFYTLALDRPAGELVVLNSNAAVTNQLLLNGGLLVTNNNTLQLAAATTTNAPAFGTLAASYVATCLLNGSPANNGGLAIAGITNATRLYPVGYNLSAYTPANLVVTGAAETFTVRASDGVAPGADADFAAGIVWEVSETTPGGNQVQTNFQWNAADEGSLFTRNGCRIVKSDGTNILPLQKGNFGAAAGSNPYTKSSGTFLFSAFSPFSVTSEPLLLPARFTYIRASWVSNAAQVTWENATEAPGTRYTVERSTDGRQFSAIETVVAPANNTANASYKILDKKVLSQQDYFYRIVATEGNNTYISQVVRLGAANSLAERKLQLMPTIINGNSFQLSTQMPTSTNAIIALTDNNGRLIFTQKMQLPAGASNQTIQLASYLPAGKYYVKVQNAEQGWQEVLPFMKQ